MKVLHEWLKDYIGEHCDSPEAVATLLTFHAFEIEEQLHEGGHDIIDVDVLPNRGSDCLCHRGIARELATITGTPLAYDPLSVALPSWPASKIFSTHITDPDATYRFSSAVITGVRVGPSPQWLRDRLAALGQKSINNVVDATNYVMYALGQPTHAFDLDKLTDHDGKRMITVRYGKAGEQITTLGGETYETTEETLHLADGTSGTLLDFAGVKGGVAAELTEETANIVVTSGNFNYARVRQTSQRFKIHTDAAKRFENGISPELTLYGLRDVVELIITLAGGTLEGYTDEYPTPHYVPSVTVVPQRVNALLGLSLRIDEIRDILDRLGARYEESDGVLSVTGPFVRTDLMIEEDYVEEIGRIYGYQHVSAVCPEPAPLTEINARHYYSERVRQVLLPLGFSEVITSSFRNKDSISLFNALASDKSCVRSSLVKNIREVLERNIPHTDLLGLPDVRVFEIGTVFEKGQRGIEERIMLTIGARTTQKGPTPADDEIVASAVAELESALGVSCAHDVKDGVAEIDFSQLLSMLPTPTEYAPHPVSEEIQYRPFSPYPFVARDIALFVPEGTDPDAVATLLTDAAGDLCVRVTLFDEFKKDGRVSYAFRLIFQSQHKTLTDTEVNEYMEAVYDAVAEEGFEVR